ncbi:hypothetical protein [Ornithinibacillus xuwenensis]|uniref:Uncharacterized protein n=1 Tax=Ornithinibacillus xuwenensis TaxID=3144668 RepID=A0ABU9XHT0_9BACI
MGNHPAKACLLDDLQATKKGKILLLHIGKKVMPIKFVCVIKENSCLVGTTSDGCKLFLNSGCIIGISILEDWPITLSDKTLKLDHSNPKKLAIEADSSKRNSRNLTKSKKRYGLLDSPETTENTRNAINSGSTKFKRNRRDFVNPSDASSRNNRGALENRSDSRFRKNRGDSVNQSDIRASKNVSESINLKDTLESKSRTPLERKQSIANSLLDNSTTISNQSNSSIKQSGKFFTN